MNFKIIKKMYDVIVLKYISKIKNKYGINYTMLVYRKKFNELER